jgi:hypothetical protein
MIISIYLFMQAVYIYVHETTMFIGYVVLQLVWCYNLWYM